MLKGSYGLSLTTADWEGFCRRAGEQGISLYHTEPMDSLTYRFFCSAGDLAALKHIAEKQGDSITVRKCRGPVNFLRKARGRPVLLLGSVALFLLFLYLPTRILFIRVAGNREIPSLQILEAASESGLRFGSAGREIRSEELKNSLMEKIPQISWAGVNIKGCVAEIAVKEQTGALITPERTGPWSLVAQRDGIVTGGSSVRKGTLVCHPGQAVRKGQTLISGLPTEDAPGNFCAAEGEIYALTLRNQRTVTPESFYAPQPEGEKSWGISLLLGKKRIKIYGTSGNQDPGCGRMYAEYYITLPGGFRLPLALAVDRYREQNLQAVRRSQAEAFAILKAAADENLKNQMLAGRILKDGSRVHAENGVYQREGTYLCHEMIGRIRQEEIGVKQDTWKES